MQKRHLHLSILILVFLGLPVFLSGHCIAQADYFSNWFARVDKAKESQPHWVTPVATTTPRLEEEFRYDQFWQENAKGVTTDNYDGGKGIELIPTEHTEVISNLPPYIEHNNPKVKDGWGDVAFLLKCRLLAKPENEGGYILTAFFGLSYPTGQFQNGAPHPVITPTIAYGKGFGNFDLQGTAGVGFPTADTSTLGRTIVWNNAFQYRLFKKFWPEVELNSTFFQDGKNDGQKQNFVTPGLLLGRFRVAGRVGLTFGGGYQIATTHFHTTNHNAIMTVRFPF